MMQIVYFSRKDQFLTELQSVAGKKLLIAPSPAKADALRNSLQGLSESDVITIAKFTSDIAVALWQEESAHPQLKRKSEMLLIFGVLKNKYFPQLGYEQFIQAYNLFSDLRSFTLDQGALASVLEDQPEEVRQALTLFWQLLEVTGYVDEHGAYQKISEGLRSGEEIPALKQTYIFWGFQHLNGQQIDLLKALAIRYQVIIPFPLSLRDKIKKSDWIHWLLDSHTTEKILEELPLAPHASWLPVNSREIGLNLKQLLRPGDQVVLGTSKLSPQHLDIVPSRSVSFKIPHKLLQTELHQLAWEIKHEFSGKSFSGLQSFLQQKKLDLLEHKKSPGYFKSLKALQLYSEALSYIVDLTDEELVVDRFLLMLLQEVVGLNQPRTSYIPLTADALEIELKDMSSLDELNRQRRIIVCIDERYGELQNLGQGYPESIQRVLASLGPVKRNELDLLYRQWEFHQLFSESHILLLMSASTLKHSLVWKRMFSGIELKPIEGTGQHQKNALTDHFQTFSKKSFEGTFSASKFQTFIDCPRKFYFNYVDPIFPKVELKGDLDPLATGTISHKIIEEYFTRHLTPEELPQLTREILGEHIRQSQLQLSAEKLQQHELTFNHRSLNGINFLVSLENLLGKKISWKLESDFSLEGSYRLRGKIDCIGRVDSILLLLDFKSTKYSASSFKEIENLESVQLWTYAHGARSMFMDFDQCQVIMGFVTLDNPAESNLLISDDVLFAQFKAAKLCRQQLFKTPFNELLKAGVERLEALALTIQQEKNFIARPRKTSACQFCELTKVCVKSELKL